jgi:2-polyprenyl-6-hydroxyphenyl methylase/3-demethylubiquinone-9 3-methyltransferase
LNRQIGDSNVKAARDRFAFGANWSSFSRHIDEVRVQEACDSLRAQLGDLSGLRFLDVGCGSGLFSLSALRLGAQEVHAFDYDHDSVATARELLRAHSSAGSWKVELGDVLDRAFVASLGQWDVVYSWGVLHHTGDMAAAWENVSTLVRPGGRLFISIYNDQGPRSRLWTKIKRGYGSVPTPLRPAYVALIMAPRELISGCVQGPVSYARSWRDYKRNRGMSRWHDLVDWVGGYPFEVAKPEEVFGFFRDRRYVLDWMSTCGGGRGCNQFRGLGDSGGAAALAE